MASIAKPDWLSAFLDVGDNQDLGIARQLELAQYMDLQGAEATAERYLLRWRDTLVAKHQNVMVEVGAVESGEVFLAERLPGPDRLFRRPVAR